MKLSEFTEFVQNRRKAHQQIRIIEKIRCKGGLRINIVLGKGRPRTVKISKDEIVR